MLGKKLLLIAILCIATHVPASGEGRWDTFTNTIYIRCMAQQGEYIWCGTGGGVVRVDRRDGSRAVYTTRDGLICNNIQSIAVGLDGVVWVSTFLGVSSFDGKTWKRYTTADGLAEDNVESIAIDSDNVKWFGTSSSGITTFDGTVWKTYDLKDLVQFPHARKIVVDQRNNKWIASYDYLISFDGANWNKIYCNGIKNVTVAPDGKIWVVQSSDSGDGDTIYRLDDGNLTKILSHGDGNGLLYLFDLLVDRNGRIWFGNESYQDDTEGRSLVMYDNGTITKFTAADGLPDAIVYSLALDENNTLWVGTLAGLLRYDGSAFKNYPGSPGCTDNYYTDAAVSRDGTLWLATSAAGVDRRDAAGGWQNLKEKDGLCHSNVISIAPDVRGGFWAGTLAGVSHFDGATWKTYPKEPGQESTIVNAIAVDRDGVAWGGAMSRIVRIEGDSLAVFPDSEVKDVVVDANNVKWFATNAGVKRFDGTTWTTFNITNGLNMAGVRAIAIGPDGSVWAGAKGKIARFDGENWTTWGMADGLCHNDVRCIAVDRDGVAWIGTFFGGVSAFDGTHWRTYTTADGLADSRVMSIAVDLDNAKWFATWGGGLSRYDGLIIRVENAPKPGGFAILANRPNPFNPSTEIGFTMPKSGKATLAVYDITGRKVRDLVSGVLSSGVHTVVWDGADNRGHSVSSGVYISRLISGNQSVSGKMTLIR